MLRLRSLVLSFLLMFFIFVSCAYAESPRHWTSLETGVGGSGSIINTKVYGYFINVSSYDQAFVVCDPSTGEALGEAYMNGYKIGERKYTEMVTEKVIKDIVVEPVKLVSYQEAYLAGKNIYPLITSWEGQTFYYPYSDKSIPDSWKYIYFQFKNPNNFPVKADINIPTIFGPQGVEVEDVYFEVGEDKWVRMDITDAYKNNMKKFGIELNTSSVNWANIQNNIKTFSSDKAEEWFQFAFVDINKEPGTRSSDSQSIWVLRPAFKEVWEWVPDTQNNNIGKVNKRNVPAFRWSKETYSLSDFVDGKASSVPGTQKDLNNNRAIKMYYVDKYPLTLIDEICENKSSKVASLLNQKYGIAFNDFMADRYRGKGSAIVNNKVAVCKPREWNAPYEISVFSIGEKERVWSPIADSELLGSVLYSRLFSSGSIANPYVYKPEESYLITRDKHGEQPSLVKGLKEFSWDGRGSLAERACFNHEIRKLEGSTHFGGGARIVFDNKSGYYVKLTGFSPKAMYENRRFKDIFYGGLGPISTPFLAPGNIYESETITDIEGTFLPKGTPYLRMSGGHGTVVLGGNVIAGVSGQYREKLWNDPFQPTLPLKMFETEEVMTPEELASFTNRCTSSVKSNIINFLGNKYEEVDVRAVYNWYPFKR